LIDEISKKKAKAKQKPWPHNQTPNKNRAKTEKLFVLFLLLFHSVSILRKLEE
jgi:hypothetical protein